MSKAKGYLLQPEVKRLNDAFHDLSQLCIQKDNHKLALDCLKESKGVAQMVADLRKAEIVGPGASMPLLPSSSLKQIEQAIEQRKKAALNRDPRPDPLAHLGGKNGRDTALGSRQYPRNESGT